MRRGAIWATLAVLAACGESGPAPDLVATGTQWPEADALFHKDPRWLGADAAFSIPLGEDRTLWIFGDTFVATSAANLRSQSEMVRNTIAVQTGMDPTTATITFHWKQDADGSPASYFAEDPDGAWYWPMQGFAADGRLYVFLARVTATPGQGLGFEADGWRLVIVDNPTAAPADWRQQRITPPDTDGLVVGQAIVRDGASVLALAEREPGDHAGYLARFDLADLAAGDLSRIKWWDGTGWSADRAAARVVIEDAGPESSIHYDALHDRFIHIRSDGFGASDIAFATAPAATGPWSAHQRFFHPPESDRPKPFVYAAKAHPELRGPDAGDHPLVVTYVSNTFDSFASLIADTTIYYPRFVRVRFEPR